MPQYLIYGKRTKPLYDIYTHTTVGPDKTFRALNERGERVNKLEEAFSFATREDAQDFIDSHKHKDGVVFEIRKAK